MHSLDQIPDNLKAFRNGKEEGFAFFFKAYHKPLCFFAGKYVKDINSMQDIVEESFIKLWDKRELFDSESGLRSYLYKTVYHGCLRWLEQEKRKAVSLETYRIVTDFPDQTYFENIIRAETLQLLNAAIEQLPAECRKVFHKLYKEGKSVAEAALELNLTNSTIKNQKARGLKLLKLRLSN